MSQYAQHLSQFATQRLFITQPILFFPVNANTFHENGGNITIYCQIVLCIIPLCCLVQTGVQLMSRIP